MQRGGFIKRTKCPKCGGNIYLDSDLYGWFEQCIQCGYTQNLQKVNRVNIETGDKYTAELEPQPVPINR
jgi:predicted nucleic-acid-binding Zn-ribbon protein